MDIVLATHNSHKAAEITEMFKGYSVNVQTLSDIGFSEDIPETGQSFEENAFIKARTIAKKFNAITLADDSGLAVDVLGGAPGIYSARYAGDDTSKEALCSKLISEMTNKSNRNASFITVMAFVDPQGIEQSFEGRVEGAIIDKMTGENGFGYDPVFYYEPYEKTMAQMSPQEKNGISHRHRALEKMKEWFKTQYNV